MDYLDGQFKRDCYEVLNQLEGKVHVVDCYGTDIFEESDFNDMDHLNKSGAIKMSNILKEIIQEIEK